MAVKHLSHRQIVLILTLLLPMVLAQAEYVPGLYLDRVKVGTYGGPTYAYNSATNFTGYSFACTTSTTIPPVISAGLALYEYDTTAGKMLSMIVSINSFGPSSVTISVLPDILKAGFAYMTYSLIGVTEDNNQVELLSWIKQNSTGYKVSSDKFTFGTVDDPYICAFFQWVTAKNPVGDPDNYWAGVNYSPKFNSSDIQLTFFYDGTYFKDAQVNILLVNRTDYSMYYTESKDGGSYSKVFTENFGVNISTYGNPVLSSKCLLGLRTIDIYYYSTSMTIFNLVTTGSTITDIYYFNAYGIKLVTACFSVASPDCTKIQDCLSCSNLTYCQQCLNSSLGYDPAQGKCRPCSTLVVGCLECYETNCNLCSQEFMLEDGLCTCIEGNIVNNSCCVIPGCISFTQSYSSGIQVCQACGPTDYQPIPVNGSCACINNKIIFDGTCVVSVTGCILYMSTASGYSCGYCNVSVGYILNSQGQCSCKVKTEYRDEMCRDICGDGYLMNISSWSCDDGNAESGDGCSSECVVEVGYICSGGSISSKSVCVYRGVFMSIQLVSIYNIEGQNKGKFSFLLRPHIINLVKMDFYAYLTLDCDSLYSISSISYIDSFLQVLVDYREDMENRNCNVTLAYDPSIIDRPASSLSFTVISENTELRLFSNYQQVDMLQLIFSLLAYSTVFVFFLSLPYKMVGVQLISCCQIAYFTLCLYDKPIIVFQSLKKFHLVTGYSPFFSRGSTGDIQGLTDRVELNALFVKSTISILAVLLPALAIWIALTVVKLCHNGRNKKGKEAQERTAESKIEKGARIVYNWLIFPFAAGFIMVLWLAAHINNSKIITDLTEQISIINSLALLLIWFALSIVFVGQLFLIFPYGGSTDCPKMKPFYIPLFLLKLLSMSILLSLKVALQLDSILEIMVCIQVLYLVFLLMGRPYSSVFMNMGAIVCQTTIVYSQALVIIRQFFTPSEDTDLIFIYALQGLIGGSVVLSFLRIVKCLYVSVKGDEKSENQSDGSKSQKKKAMYERNKYSLGYREKMLRKPIITMATSNLPGDLSSGNRALQPASQFTEQKMSAVNLEEYETLQRIKDKLKQDFAEYDRKRRNQMMEISGQ